MMLYKGKYLIALYDEEDFPVAVADNIQDLMAQSGLPMTTKQIDSMRSSVTHAVVRKHRMKWKGAFVSVHLIDATE